MLYTWFVGQNTVGLLAANWRFRSYICENWAAPNNTCSCLPPCMHIQNLPLVENSKPLSLQVPLKSHHSSQYEYTSQMSLIIIPLPPAPRQCLIRLPSIGNWRLELLLYVGRMLLLMLALDVERPLHFLSHLSWTNRCCSESDTADGTNDWSSEYNISSKESDRSSFYRRLLVQICELLQSAARLCARMVQKHSMRYRHLQYMLPCTNFHLANSFRQMSRGSSLTWDCNLNWVSKQSHLEAKILGLALSCSHWWSSLH